MTRQQALAARPVRLVEGPVAGTGDGGGRLSVPLRPKAWAKWLLRFPAGATKTFELDPLGLLVWESCDGKTSVLQIVRKLERRYHFSSREAEVSTVAFLRTLIKKGLIGMAPRRGKGRT
jgi:hypothetical protein